MCYPGARFSKAPNAFRVCEAIFNCIGMSLCMKGNFVHISNMWKEQLCKLKFWDFWYGFPGRPKTFRDLPEMGPILRLSKIWPPENIYFNPTLGTRLHFNLKWIVSLSHDQGHFRFLSSRACNWYLALFALEKVGCLIIPYVSVALYSSS